MQRAFQLATYGKGRVSPNPLVGCVIVYNDQIIGEGYHQKYGESHAEVNAINAVKNQKLLAKSTLYVTLEPCSHFGKTPPCSDLIVRKKIPEVIIANGDPNPKVNGRGIAILKKNGVMVQTGVLSDIGEIINKRFFTSIRKKRPYITLKWAQTADGYIARGNFDSKWISNQYSRMLVHKLRAEEDAILVGYNTAKHDDPSLTVRDWSGPSPVRLIIDPKLELSSELKVFDHKQLTIVYNSIKEGKDGNIEFVQLESSNFLESLLSDLNMRSIHSVLIEGGRSVLEKFIEANAWDEAHLYEGEKCFGSGIPAPTVTNARSANTESILGNGKRVFYNLANTFV